MWTQKDLVPKPASVLLGMGSLAPANIPATAISTEDVDLCALRQKLAETSKLYEVDDGSHAATEKADAADNELTALSERQI